MKTLFTITCVIVWILFIPFMVLGFIFGFVEKCFLQGKDKFDEFDDYMEQQSEKYENENK